MSSCALYSALGLASAVFSLAALILAARVLAKAEDLNADTAEKNASGHHTGSRPAAVVNERSAT